MKPPYAPLRSGFVLNVRPHVRIAGLDRRALQAVIAHKDRAPVLAHTTRRAGVQDTVARARTSGKLESGRHAHRVPLVRRSRWQENGQAATPAASGSAAS